MISNETTLNTQVGISLPPQTIVGYRANGKPIYNIAGGASEVIAGDDGVDDDDSDVDDSDEDDSDDEDDDYTPPTREEFAKLLADKKKADSESAARKRLLRQAGLDPKTGKPARSKVVLDPSDDDDDDADTEVADQAAAQEAQKGVNRAKQEKHFQRQLEREIAKTERRVKDESVSLIAAVPTTLTEEGWNGKNLNRILKLIDLDNVSVDEDGEVDGLIEEIEALKVDFPEFFKRTRMKDAAKDLPDRKTVGGGKKPAPASEENLSWSDRLERQLYGKNN